MWREIWPPPDIINTGVKETRFPLLNSLVFPDINDYSRGFNLSGLVMVALWHLPHMGRVFRSHSGTSCLQNWIGKGKKDLRCLPQPLKLPVCPWTVLDYSAYLCTPAVWLHIFYLYSIHKQNVTRFNRAYSLIAFNDRVTSWFQRVRSLPCACAYVALFACRLAYNHYAIAHAYNAANTQAQGSDPARWSQKVTLSSKAIGV